MAEKQGDLVKHAVQMKLGLEVATVRKIEDPEVGSIEMGVFKDGVGFMSARALGRLCGVEHTNIVRWSQKEGGALEGSKLGDLLKQRGFEGGALFRKVGFEGREINAYSEIVCLAFLEYYAFESEERYRTAQALRAFRDLAGASMRQFIYKVTGYDPDRQAALAWQVFHDRLLLNRVPSGYFSIFGAMSDLALDAIRYGLDFDDETIPDISVGQMWSKFWARHGLEAKYGERIKYGHIYPHYFRQAAANEYIEAFIYPISALGEFKNWLQSDYVLTHFPGYLDRKRRQGAIDQAKAEQLLAAWEPMFLPKRT